MSAPDRAYNLAELTALPLEDMAGELERLKTPPFPGGGIKPAHGGNQQTRALPE